eukprot:TRINITY_DN3169_c2_g1_i1.p1 TRINITY_DN3169_c2_g1~~TRINITY_DN3169_c2_g1_i1.p1  ORF type:complete len:154 (+),score=30.50 TRINITY_DN3169_c2_g1_i1:63-464(+)
MTTGLPSWIVVPSGIDDEPPECKPEQMKLDECLEGLQREISGSGDVDEENAFLQDLEELEEAERAEEEAFLEAMGADDDASDTPPSPPASESEDEAVRDEPRSQVVIEHLASVRNTAALFHHTDIVCTNLRRV